MFLGKKLYRIIYTHTQAKKMVETEYNVWSR